MAAGSGRYRLEGRVRVFLLLLNTHTQRPHGVLPRNVEKPSLSQWRSQPAACPGSPLGIADPPAPRGCAR